ncbi:hypothetical protein OsI_20796 [Oryza sativa Indica Group]|uniref:Uncharacterized protein n=1 Tax=Oryza sativa subsp. indica TaxID=39946 RepID=A2Y6Y7_ORYSI|nr:hypothetical protein OsI_20796 [Oryza sativa Indica Group]
MARDPRGRGRRKAGHVRSLQDARRVVDMYGHRVGFKAKVVALHGGIRQARAVHAILSRQLGGEKKWEIRDMPKLELLIAVHRDIAAAAESLDYLIRAFTTAQHPPPAPGSPISLESVRLRLTACVLDDADEDDDGAYHFAGDELLRVTSLQHAGNALLHKQLGGGIVEDKVRGLGELLLGLATSMITEGPIPSVLFDDVPVQHPPLSKAKLLQFMRQAKRQILDVWDARISGPNFDGMRGQTAPVHAAGEAPSP